MPPTTPPEDTDMAVPRRKTSPSRRVMRRSADALKKPTYAEDKDSGELRRPHHLDLKTGMYKGRQALKGKKESLRQLFGPRISSAPLARCAASGECRNTKPNMGSCPGRRGIPGSALRAARAQAP